MLSGAYQPPAVTKPGTLDSVFGARPEGSSLLLLPPLPCSLEDGTEDEKVQTALGAARVSAGRAQRDRAGAAATARQAWLHVTEARARLSMAGICLGGARSSLARLSQRVCSVRHARSGATK